MGYIYATCYPTFFEPICRMNPRKDSPPNLFRLDLFRTNSPLDDDDSIGGEGRLNDRICLREND